MTDRKEEHERHGGKKQGPAATSPYGPHHGEGDEAAGGADSSPFEATPSEERQKEAQKTLPAPPSVSPEAEP